MVSKIHLFTIPCVIILTLSLVGCGSLTKALNRDREIHKQVSLLELGVSRSIALSSIGYDPDQQTREVEDGLYREILIFKGWYAPDIFSPSSPMIYTLIFEDDKLVVIDIQEDLHERRLMEMRRIERERMELEKKRIEANKAAAEKKKADEQNKADENKNE